MGTLFAIAVVATIVSQGALGSLSFNGGLLAPKAGRINSGPGLQRIFGMNGWIELGKSLLKVVLMGSIGTYMLWKTAHFSFGLASTDLNRAVGSLGATLMNVLLVMAFGLVAIAMFDAPTQIMQLLRKLRMTKQEVKDEHKESEGIEMKGHLRAKQREMLSGGMKKALGEADVVLTNPTHFAVALRYDRTRDQVPVVVAKGRGATALAMREAAKEIALPVLEYPALAGAVYYTSREGQEVRDDLYPRDRDRARLRLRPQRGAEDRRREPRRPAADRRAEDRALRRKRHPAPLNFPPLRSFGRETWSRRRAPPPPPRRPRPPRPRAAVRNRPRRRC
ncbi:EscU/YscU/HrcU family type III secretion system export apparatus switch protein [Sphingomonas sp. MMS24-JH45]